MSNIFQAEKTCDSSEILTLLAADIDFDEKGFDESNPIILVQISR